MGELTISSTQNPRVKQLLLLQQKSSERRKQGVFVVEGQRELQHCMEGGYEVVTRFICPALYQGEVPCDAVLVTPAVYEKIAYRGTTEGIVAVIRTHPKTLSDLQLPVNPLLMVLERVEKPGNLVPSFAPLMPPRLMPSSYVTL